MSSYLFILVFVFSILLGYLSGYLNSKKIRSIFVALGILTSSIFYIYIQSRIQNVNFIPLAIIFLFQFINLISVIENRYELPNTRRRITRTGIFLAVPTVVLSLFNVSFLFSPLFIQLSVLIIGILFAAKALLASSRIQKASNIPDGDLPTISVLIPARNEDSSLASCIESVVSSNYPKLEVLVLDDCSQDNSSEIIKSFAQKGVRFIQGDQPKENWLAKNQAYEILAASASGDWYLFMGVDVRLGSGTIRNAISSAIKNNKEMVSLVPIIKGLGFKDAVIPLRVFWELVVPKFISKYPPVLSTCWLITDTQFKALGGMSAVSQSVLPERYFANNINKSKKYQFLTGGDDLAIESHKNYRDQLETSQRLLYPQIKKSYLNLLILTLVAYYLLFPYWIIVESIVKGDYELALSPILSLTPVLFSLYLISDRQGINHKLLRLLLLPYLIIQELFCLYTSAYRYEFSEVLWKGRNVCYPNLKVIPRLPKI